jgi:hypothetical protein
MMDCFASLAMTALFPLGIAPDPLKRNFTEKHRKRSTAIGPLQKKKEQGD